MMKVGIFYLINLFLINLQPADSVLSSLGIKNEEDTKCGEKERGIAIGTTKIKTAESNTDSVGHSPKPNPDSNPKPRPNSNSNPGRNRSPSPSDSPQSDWLCLIFDLDTG
jgi:hypothetical protein